MYHRYSRVARRACLVVLSVVVLAGCETYINPMLKFYADDSDIPASTKIPPDTYPEAISLAQSTIRSIAENRKNLSKFNRGANTVLATLGMAGTGSVIYDGPKNLLEGIAIAGAAVLGVEQGIVNSLDRINALDKGRDAIQCGMDLTQRLAKGRETFQVAFQALSVINLSSGTFNITEQGTFSVAKSLVKLGLVKTSFSGDMRNARKKLQASIEQSRVDLAISAVGFNENKDAVEKLVGMKVALHETIEAEIRNTPIMESAFDAVMALKEGEDAAHIILWRIVRDTRNAITAELNRAIDLSGVLQSASNAFTSVHNDIIKHYEDLREKEAAKAPPPTMPDGSDPEDTDAMMFVEAFAAVAGMEADKLQAIIDDCKVQLAKTGKDPSTPQSLF